MDQRSKGRDRDGRRLNRNIRLRKTQNSRATTKEDLLKLQNDQQKEGRDVNTAINEGQGRYIERKTRDIDNTVYGTL